MNEGAVHGPVRLWLRAEGVATCLVAAYLYARESGSWLVFAALFFVPDISFAAYLAGSRVGAAIYNVAHSYVGPVLLAVTSLTTGTTLTRSISLVLQNPPQRKRPLLPLDTTAGGGHDRCAQKP
jgi:hypothetical protein